MNFPSRRTDRQFDRVGHRRGFTLIEMVACVALLTIVLTSVAVTISSLHRMNIKLRDEFPRSATAVSLGLQLRSDVHSAKQATLVTSDKPEPLLRLAMADERFIEYSAKQSRISRFIKRGDQVERTEVFMLPRGSELSWSIDESATPLVTLAIRSHVGKLPDATDDVREARIVAMVGLDYVTR